VEVRLSVGRGVVDLTPASPSAVRAPEGSRPACRQPAYLPAGMNLPPWQRRCAPWSLALGSRLFVSAHQGEGSEEESSDLLVTGLTGLGLAAPAELGSEPARADPLAAPEWLVADGAGALAAACGRALHKRTCGFRVALSDSNRSQHRQPLGPAGLEGLASWTQGHDLRGDRQQELALPLHCFRQ
jgi:hypothetical protein